MEKVKMYLPHEGKEVELQVRESIMKGYKIWPIGNNGIDGYIPVAKFDNNHHMITGTLYMIKCEGAKEIMLAKGFISNFTPKGIRSYLKRWGEKKANTLKVVRLQRALPYLENIKFD